MLRAGRLGNNACVIPGHEFRVGDRVLCRHNDTRLGVRNGTRATITEISDDILTLRTDGGAVRPVPLAYADGHLDHGYAVTGHAAQEATVERAFVLLGDSGALQEWGYVACSRARAETRLYLTTEAIEPELRHPQREIDAVPGSAARVLGAIVARNPQRIKLQFERDELDARSGRVQDLHTHDRRDPKPLLTDRDLQPRSKLSRKARSTPPSRGVRDEWSTTARQLVSVQRDPLLLDAAQLLDPLKRLVIKPIRTQQPLGKPPQPLLALLLAQQRLLGGRGCAHRETLHKPQPSARDAFDDCTLAREPAPSL
jgi:hypothetical protein